MVAMRERAIVCSRNERLKRVTVNERRSKPYLEAAVRIAWELAEARGWKMAQNAARESKTYHLVSEQDWTRGGSHSRSDWTCSLDRGLTRWKWMR